ncbi:MAG: trigger factor [Candidatus Harrisonbacteria bacterium CG10_big_fil_rev_8_21_14_0_10_44_23]|uniref:Trigger factor n=1 Tax=Candidatus Harrisonbacteria bacterium CG10_big_fil_rev_8_21_14_0_10_44_23 TaxID=1974585 RepID=A0A2H0UPU6_9BACT|nr:MAG: trigger factor [Candidatus Harrisonbacteria bacterium CG10_big_fil_rev_8_21_14_0_10_44_23]
MKKDIKNLGNSKIELSVHLTKEEFEPYWSRAYGAAASKIELKGFRKGAAPKEMVDSAINKDKVFEEAMKEAIGNTLSQISKEEEWAIIDQPKVEVKETAVDGGLKYQATLTVFPEIKLGDYKAIAKKAFGKNEEVEVEDKEVKKTIDYLLGSRAKEKLVDREAKKGDLIEADIKTTFDGKPLEGAALSGDKFILGESRFMPGFDDKLIGKKGGEKLTFSLKAPKDYWSKEVQGKQLDFAVELKSVFERELPKLDDEFASSLGSGFKTVADLEKSIQEGIKTEKREKLREKQRIEMIEGLAKNSKMDVPEVMIERTIDSMVADIKRMMPEAFNGEKAEEEERKVREQFRERAKKNVEGNLVIYELAKKEGIKPSEEELQKAATMQGVELEKYYDALYSQIQNQKVFDYLEGLAK